MAKRYIKHNLSLLLSQFALSLLTSLFGIGFIYISSLTFLQKINFIYPPYLSNQQIEAYLDSNEENFKIPNKDFLPDYVLLDINMQPLQSNLSSSKTNHLIEHYISNPNDNQLILYTYSNGNSILFQWHYQREFTNLWLRSHLPAFEYLWMSLFICVYIIFLIYGVKRLKKKLSEKLNLFTQVSQKISDYDLTFPIPKADIAEFDVALNAMDKMRIALSNALTEQWQSVQDREAEISALAHDIKTPLTLIGGNAELLIEESQDQYTQELLKTILYNQQRVVQYINSLQKQEESWKIVSTSEIIEKIKQDMIPFANTNQVSLIIDSYENAELMAKPLHLRRAINNIIQNAIEHSASNTNVTLQGQILDNTWQIMISDCGPGFSKEALHHATKRLWKEDTSRHESTHQGLGLHFANKVINEHNGKLLLSNNSGAIVTITLPINKTQKSTISDDI